MSTATWCVVVGVIDPVPVSVRVTVVPHVQPACSTAVLLWYSKRTLYTGYMSSLVICSYVSLIFYILAPTAPPRYNGVATNLLQPATASSAHGLPGLIHIGELVESDRFAALPSLHAAYAVLFAYFTTKLRAVYSLVSIPITVGILFSTIYLGQHYLIDLVAGG